MQKRDLLLTFDYELFLGAKSGSVKKCLLEPTDLLLNLFDAHGIKNAIFFVDTTYLIRLKEQNNDTCKVDFESISAQIRTLIRKGHYVFPHIHPHWIDAVYDADSNQWSLKDYSKYRFHHASAAEKEELFAKSVSVLKEIIEPENPGYKLSGYRAGGWSLQPFEDFRPFFERYGITKEFSVVPGFKNLSDAQYFDFSGCPAKKVYTFSDDPLEEATNGKYTEYTISKLPVTGRMYLLGKVWGKYLWKTGQRSLGDGSGVVIKDTSVTKNKEDLLGSENEEMLSVELLTKVKLPHYKRFLRNNNYMHFISHPKMLSLHNINCFGQFLKWAKKQYILQTDFSVVEIQ
jgi:hypothetical protein